MWAVMPVNAAAAASASATPGGVGYRHSSVSRSLMHLQHRDVEPLNQLLNLPTQKGKRGNDKEQVLHARGVVIGSNDLIGHKRPVFNVGRKREGYFARRGEDAGPEDPGLAFLLNEPEFDAEPAEALEGQHLFRMRRGGRGLADQGQQFGVVVVHE